MNTEKQVESNLTLLLTRLNFKDEYIYYSPIENEILKNIFSNASKYGNGRGIPDRLIFNEKTLIIIECKKLSLKNAINDLKIYKNKILFSKDLNIFFIAYVSENLYKIFIIGDNNNFKEVDITFSYIRSLFKHEELLYKKEDMKKELHKIHNYIRDYTKISNEDKSFFISCILISFRKENFFDIIERKTDKRFIYDILKDNLQDFKIDVSVFEFLRNDTNNVHFYNIINMVKNVLNNNPSIDLMNYFYSEFVSYNNTDGKSLGIVLTPSHIVKLMIRMLNIDNNDVFLDLCSGTGSFTLEALKYNPQKTITIEYQTKLFTLLKSNMILRSINTDNNLLIQGDCFKQDIVSTKSAINPPYGMKDKNELDFVLKQLESVNDKGLVISIMPSSTINNTKFLTHKKKLLDISTPKIIINLNNNLFYPNASVQCCIVLLEKIPYNNTDVLFINYENDGFVIEKHIGKVKINNYDYLYNNILNIIHNCEETNISVKSKIKYDDDWNYHNYNSNVNFTIIKNELKEQLLSLYMARQKLNYDSSNIVFENTKNYFIHEIFDIHSCKRITLKYANNNIGNIPYISSSSKNNGITSMINIKTHKKNCITFANSGSVGSCFYHDYDICATDSIFVLYLKKQYIHFSSNEKIMCCLSLLLSKNKVKYNFGRACRLNKIKNDFIPIPCDNRGFPILNKLNS